MLRLKLQNSSFTFVPLPIGKNTMFPMTGNSTLDMILFIVILLFSASFHEAAHAFAAYRCGDPTGKELGRITLNPLRHIDLFNTILLPTILYFTAGLIFGGAKPVPINPALLRKPDRDLAIAAAAGPISNLILALLAVIVWQFAKYGVMRLPENMMWTATYVFANIILLNLLLAFFNLLPIPPLDGSRVARYLIPPLRDAYDHADQFGLIIFLVVFMLFPGVFKFITKLLYWAWQGVEYLDRLF